MRDAVKDAGLSALVALGIFGAMVGLQTHVTNTGTNDLVFRPVTVVVLVALTFAGRLGLVLWKASRPVATKAAAPSRLAGLGRFAGPVLLAANTAVAALNAIAAAQAAGKTSTQTVVAGVVAVQQAAAAKANAIVAVAGVVAGK